MEVDQIDIARTNYILAKLREEFGLEYEKYIKWFYSAFNGAGLTNEQRNSFGTVLFHKDKPEYNYGDFKIAQIKDFWVVIDLKHSPNTEKIISKANDEFEDLIKEESDRVVGQVRRFFTEITFLNNDLKEKVERFIEEIEREFPKAELFKSFERFPPVEIQDNVIPVLFSFDAEVLLDEPISENLLIEKLRKFVPKIDKPLYGFGFLSGYDQLENFPIHLHLYARQF
jgi:hypothetical protein